MAGRKSVMVELDKHVAASMVELAVNMTAELTATTPVDTGWARANWVPSLGAPDFSGSSREQASVDAQGAGLAAVSGYEPGGGPIYVSNGVPYIQRLNAGHSAQAPVGFVEQAIDKTLSDARGGR